MNKICKKCSRQKKGSEFYNNSAKSDRLSTWCISCSKEYAKSNPASTEIRRLQNLRYSKSKKGRQTRKIHTKRKWDEIKQDPELRLKFATRNAVSRTLFHKQKHSNTFNVLGYSVKELKIHLEEQFTKGMSWENYGKWHIDHIVPVSFFEFDSTRDVEFKMCWRLENLQPLWAKDNIRKSNKLSLTG